MLFDEEDASLLKKWIVKRLEDISDADSDVLADYVLALLRHDQAEEEVKRLCVEQLEDFLREHTIHFVQDVFTALQTKAFRSVNATLTGGALSAHMPTPQESPPPTVVSASPPSTVMHGDRSDGGRSQKRPYFDRDEPEEEERLKPHHGRERGSKMARRGGAHGPGRWARGGTGGGVEGGNSGGGRGNSLFPGAQHNLANVVPPVVPMPQMFGLPPATRPGLFPPWIPPSNPHDPIPAFLAAQAAAAWGFPGLPGTKIDGEKAIIKKVGERCMDYDEKGFCMKGDTCPYEHGVDHIVVPGQEAKAEEYDPNDSMLISSSRIVAEKKSTPAPSHRGRGGRGGQRGGKSGRAGFSSTGPNFDRSNTRLVVENIPEDKLSESAIKEFFGSFGNVVSVDIHQHKNLAILNFSQWEVAKAAYDSPAPIFDNRFVKVFWCKPSLADGGTELLPTTGARNFSHSKSELEEVKIDIEEVKRKQEELQRAHEEKMAKKKANEEAAMELQKRKEELIKLQKEEQKKLMEKLAKKRAATTAASASAAKTTTDFNALPSSPSSSDHTNRVQSANGDAKPKSEMTKADATTAALKAQLEALQAEAEALGIDQNASAEEAFDLEGFRGRGRGRFPTRGGYFSRGRGYSSYRGGSRGTIYAPRGRGAGGGLPTMKLDNRTKRVAVTAQGFKGEKEEAFRHYLINNGIELEAIEPHPEKEDTQVFTFQDRRNAEKFVFSGNDIPDVGSVTMAWHHNTPNPNSSHNHNQNNQNSNIKSTALTSNSNTLINSPSTVTAQVSVDETDLPMRDSSTFQQDDSYDLAEDDEGRWLPE